ncbi:MAG: DUF262 domain-containing protein [Verrucomicrobia bacterium]|nr:DUF262 domain-containing protein [Verrucomicrobiota bacterium]
MNPTYQREGNIWPDEKKQLLIDSLINRFDIPKLYFHEYLEPQLIEGKKKKYAVIDGKQRLLAIWDFIDNAFPLGDRFEYLPDPSLNLSGLTYRELTESYPHVKAQFDNWPLAIMVVRTDDIELIEDMFSRLNEAVPLNAAEKRNAFGGPLPPLIRKLVKESLFVTKLPFKNSRYRHFDVACKFLYLCMIGSPADTKKIKLDEFVKDFQKSSDTKKGRELYAATTKILTHMSDIFTVGDPLLKNIGTVVAYFLIFKRAAAAGELTGLSRKRFVEFDAHREKNSEIAAKDITKADYEFMKFDELTGSVNDGHAIRFRCRLISKFVLGATSKTALSFPEKV